MTQYNGPRRAPQQRPGAPRPSSGSAPRRPAAPQRPGASQQRPAPRQAPRRAAAPQRAPQPRSGGGAEKGGIRIPRDFWVMLVIGVAVCVGAWFAQLRWPNGFELETAKAKTTASSSSESKAVSEIYSSGPLRINELMSSNRSTLLDAEGKTPDWIEIMNVSSSTVNLSGYSIAKNENSANVFQFPDAELAPGECVIVFADSDTKEEAGSEYHAPLRLSSKGGSLMLFGPSGTAVDSINYPALDPDTSYAREDRQIWSVCSVPTPGYPNDTDMAAASGVTSIEITEMIASNTQYAPDSSGVCHDYIELHNKGSEAVDLSGWYLSDDPERPKRWRFPSGFVLQPGEYRIVYASGQDREENGETHASFGLNSEGETVTLSDPLGQTVDTATYDLLSQDEAWVKNADGTWSKGTPTPGAAN